LVGMTTGSDDQSKSPEPPLLPTLPCLPSCACRRVANEHHENLELDSLRAYHFGSKFMVEAEVGGCSGREVAPPPTG
jgi:hypothetical protein